MSTVECIACGHVGASKTKGSLWITIILLFIFFPGAIVYEIWRRSGGGVCSACGSNHVKLYVPRLKQVQPRTINQEQPVRLPSKTRLVSHDSFSHNAGNRVQFDDNGVEQKNCPDCRELIRFDARKCKHCGSMVGD